MKIRTLITRASAAMLLGFSQFAQSAIVHLPGDTVDFYYDDAQPGMAAYGSLTVVGDSIFATPDQFLAQSTGGTDTFSALGTVTVVAKPGYQFEAINVVQQGDYTMSGASATVTATGTLTLVDSDNAATNEVVLMTNSGLPGISDGLTRLWSSSGGFDLTTVMWDGVTSVDLSLETILTASAAAGSGDSAFIQNKFTGGGMVTIQTGVVPVPAAIWLMVSGILGLAAVGRRRS